MKYNADRRNQDDRAIPHSTGEHNPHWASHMLRLEDVGRLESQVSEADLARVLALGGDEDILDLGSGTGFYTDRIAALTTGTVYALEIVPEMLAHHAARGLPDSVRLVRGDMTDLASGEETSATHLPDGLAPACVDVVTTIATWHEIDGRLDVPGVAALLRPRGRLTVIDWRKDPATWDHGPPEEVRYSTDDVTGVLEPHFEVTGAEDIGPCMFAVTARRR